MINFIIRRLLASIVLSLLLVAIIFFALRILLPGDPTQMLAGENAPESVIAQIRQNQGLDRPVSMQFLYFLRNLSKGDLGISIMTRQPVFEQLLGAMPITVRLTLFCFLFSMGFGILFGVLTAYYHDTWIDNLIRVLTITGSSLPTFWLGLMLILVFSVKLRLFPVIGSIEFKGMILPVITLGLGFATYISRLVRASMLEVLNSDFIRTARAKGLHERGVVIKHGLRNILIPILTVAGFQIGGMLGGAVITEAVFNMPGMGTLMINAIYTRDYPVIQGATLFVVLVYFLCNLLVDLSYAYVDPRIRYS